MQDQNNNSFFHFYWGLFTKTLKTTSFDVLLRAFTTLIATPWLAIVKTFCRSVIDAPCVIIFICWEFDRRNFTFRFSFSFSRLIFKNVDIIEPISDDEALNGINLLESFSLLYGDAHFTDYFQKLAVGIYGYLIVAYG